MVAFDLVLLAASVLLLLAPRLRRLRGHDGALIGAASGALFGLSDIAVKALFGVAGHGVATVLLSPWLALALLGGLIAQYVSARSLQTGDAVTVTALTGVAVNVANIAGGILIFGDPLAHGLAGSLIEAAAFAAICIGAFLTPVRAATQPRSGRRAGAIAPEPAAAFGPAGGAPMTLRRGHGVDGLRYDPAAPGSLTDAVNRLDPDPALRAATAREARRSVNGASWRRATEALRRCYEAACNARPGARTAVPAPPLTPDGDAPDTTGPRQMSA
jgi:hypothetical protein